MGEDAFRCALTINSTDNRFWKATLSDGYYMCDGAAQYDSTNYGNELGEYADAATADNICQELTPSGNTYAGATDMTAESATFNNWEIPPNFDDDDDRSTETALENRWCTSPNVEPEDSDTDVVLDPRACTKIKCYMQRQLGTGDDYDFNFEVGNDSRTTDYMLIKPQRAKIYFNTNLSFTAAFGNSENFNKGPVTS